MRQLIIGLLFLSAPAASWHTSGSSSSSWLRRSSSSSASRSRQNVVVWAGGFGASKAKAGGGSSSSSKKGGKKGKAAGGKKKKSATGPANAAASSTAAAPRPPSPGGSSFEAAAARNPAEAKRILELYGGDIQKGTVARITAAREKLAAEEPLLAEAMALRQEKLRFDASVAKLSLLQQASVPPEHWEQSRRRDTRLETLATDHGVTAEAVHNAFQRLTWDASADAKAFRASADLSKDMRGRLDRALALAAEATKVELPAELQPSSSPPPPRKRLVCDVGTGTGVLVPEFVRNGIPAEAVVGVDLSPEMTRVAAKAHPAATFVTADFLTFEGVPTTVAENSSDGGGGGTGAGEGSASDNAAAAGGSCFDAVVFCMALHDLPDPAAALRRAAHLVRPGGRVVVAHPRGAAHVQMQHRRSPEMVPHVLPTAADLKALCADYGEGRDLLGKKLRLELAPAAPGSPEDDQGGYLAVLEAYI
jgi:SAM-dependent methyltransferase